MIGHLLLFFLNELPYPAGNLDTREKRASAINVSLPWRGMWPLPDGVLDTGDRLQLSDWYRGIDVAGLPTELGITVEYLSGSTWLDLSPDLHSASGIRIKSGIDGDGPLDGVASPGECLFTLNNSYATYHIGHGLGLDITRLLGTYSPLHVNARTGWTWGVPIRVTAYDPSTASYIPLHRGKAWVIDPLAGQHGSRLVRVVSYDGLYELMNTEARQVAITSGATESELIAAVLDAVPADVQPLARSMDVGADTFSYAFHDVGGGENALSLINDVAIDAHGWVAMRGDGTFVFRNRHTREDGVSAGTFDDTMVEFTGPSTLDQAVNLVRVTIHPPQIDDLATTVLYVDQTVRGVPPGQTDEFWVSYSDPTDPARQLIGALDVTATYTANAMVDGTGEDITASVTVTVLAFASTAKITITNGHSSLGAYFVTYPDVPSLMLLGQGVYSVDAQTYEASSTQPYGTRPLAIDLRYQDRAAIAQSYASFIEQQRHSLATQPQSVAFRTKAPGSLLMHALARDVGDVITVTETMTGYAAVETVIQSKEIEIAEGLIVSCRWGLAPTAPFLGWKIGVAGRSEIGVTTRVGF